MHEPTGHPTRCERCRTAGEIHKSVIAGGLWLCLDCHLVASEAADRGALADLVSASEEFAVQGEPVPVAVYRFEPGREPVPLIEEAA